MPGEDSPPPPPTEEQSQEQPETLTIDPTSIEDRRSHSPSQENLLVDEYALQYRDYRRAKSPFELGRKENVLKSSSKAIIDKASVMDISSASTNVEEDINKYFKHVYESLIFDMASISDITAFAEAANLKIVVVEEDDEESKVGVVVKEGEDDSLAKKKLRLNKMKLEKMLRKQQNLLIRNHLLKVR